MCVTTRSADERTKKLLVSLINIVKPEDLEQKKEFDVVDLRCDCEQFCGQQRKKAKGEASVVL